MENLFFFLPGIWAENYCSGVSGRGKEEWNWAQPAVGLKIGRPLDGYPAARSGCKNEWRDQLMVRTEITLGVGGF